MTFALTPASPTPVRPTEFMCVIAARNAAIRSASLDCGMTVLSKSIALSTKTPEGLPAASRSIRPPTGSRVSFVMPAACSAFELSQVAWPSIRSRATGRSATAASSSCRGREATQIPDDLIPSVAHQPGALRIRLRIGAYSLLGLLQAGRARQLNLHTLQTQIDYVAVRIDQSRNQRLTLPVDHPSRRVFRTQTSAVADLENSSRFERERLNGWRLAPTRVYP